jgi:hypothetical protein
MSRANPETDRVYDVRHAAAALRVSLRTLKGALAAGDLPPPDRGSKLMFALGGFSRSWIEAARQIAISTFGSGWPLYRSFSRRRRVPSFDPQERDPQTEADPREREPKPEEVATPPDQGDEALPEHDR